MKKIIYLDHAAATPLHPDVKKAMQPFFHDQYANPSALHSLGQQARIVVEKSRTDVAELLNARSREIFFTGSGTESNNLALFGVVAASKVSHPHVIISSIEHSSVLEPVKELKRRGISVSIVPVNQEGFIDMQALKKAITKRTVLISVIYANNEIGTVQPIRDIAKIIRDVRSRFGHTYPYFHTDACQASAYCEMDTQKLHVDLMTLNASKVYGPKGVGVLYVRAGTAIQPLMWGGQQESGLRPGTENVAGIVGMASALQLSRKRAKTEAIRLEKLCTMLMRGIQRSVPQVNINGPMTNRLSNNVHVSFPGYDGEAVVLYLNSRGIAAATGAACTAQAGKESHVLKACGFDADRVRGGVRFSLGLDTTADDIRTVIKEIPSILSKL